MSDSGTRGQPAKEAAPWITLPVTIIILVTGAFNGVGGELTSRDVTVPVEVASLERPGGGLELSWPESQFTVTEQSVFRRGGGESEWGAPLRVQRRKPTESPERIQSGFLDHTAAPGVVYEYQVIQLLGSGPGLSIGYAVGGTGVLEPHFRGRVILLVESDLVVDLSTELELLTKDLTGDGWEVARAEVDRSAAPADVKGLIRAIYLDAPDKTRSLILLGRIPVPYSGHSSVDGHGRRAWPADAFYADLDGTWTDSLVDAADNVPGDGKFDQSELPSDVELETGRIDVSQMSQLVSPDEKELIRRYLARNHAYRHGMGSYEAVPRRGLIDDRIGFDGAASPSAAGWRNFMAFFSEANVIAGDWKSAIQQKTYLWAMGAGRGSNHFITGVATSAELAALPNRAVFSMFFGSFSGNWDQPNNLLRAPLIGEQSLTLATMWAGRPQWHLYHAALGETLGFGTRVTQNNSDGFLSGSNARGVHVALMGDPTLRLHVVSPPLDLMSKSGGSNAIALEWSRSPDPEVEGYHVYRAPDYDGPFTRLSDAPVAGTTFLDKSSAPGRDYVYMVRARKLETSGSGSYFNLSQGIFAHAAVTHNDAISELEVYVLDDDGNRISLGDGEAVPFFAEFRSQAKREFVIENIGTEILELHGEPAIELRGVHSEEFEVATHPAKKVAVGEAIRFSIRFDPRSPGEREAEVRIASSDEDETDFTFALSGEMAAPVPIASVLPASLDITVPSGEETRLEVSVRNHGDAPLTYTVSSDYAWLDSRDDPAMATRWIEISHIGEMATELEAIDDASSAPVAMGFEFPFYGREYDTVRVGSNGIISFAEPPVEWSNSLTLPSSEAPAALIALFWSDLLVDGRSGIFTAQVDPDTFVISYRDVALQTAPQERLTAQIQLRATGAISLVYRHVPANLAVNPTIGLQNEARDQGIRIPFSNKNQLLLGEEFSIQISPLAIGNWLRVNGPAGGTIDPGQSEVVQLANGRELAFGSYAGKILLGSNDPANPLLRIPVNVTGGRPHPEITILGSDREIAFEGQQPVLANGTDFGSIAPGMTVGRTFVIANTGSAPLLIQGIDVAGVGFDVGPGILPLSIDPNSREAIEITFDGSSVGAIDGEVTITNDDQNEATFRFPITATVAATFPLLNVKGNGEKIVAGSDTSSEHNGTDFGPVNLGSTLGFKFFEIVNDGDSQLDVAAIEVGGDGFRLRSEPGEFSLQPGGSTTLILSFTPSEAGLSTGMVSILSNDGTQTPYRFAISARGTTPKLRLVGNGVEVSGEGDGPRLENLSDFGAVAFGPDRANPEHRFRIVNDGEGPLILGPEIPPDDGGIEESAKIRLDGSKAFRISSFADRVIMPGQFADFGITFQPPSEDGYQATVSIFSNDPSVPRFTFAITGRGVRSLEAWRAYQFGDENTDVTISGDLADPDEDGWSNLAEFAFLTDPLAAVRPTSVLELEPAADGQSVALHFDRRIRSVDLLYRLELSVNLLRWEAIAESRNGNELTPLAGNVSVFESPYSAIPSDLRVKATASVALVPDEGDRYFRLSISRL